MSTDAKRNETISAMSRRIDEIRADRADFQLLTHERIQIHQLEQAIEDMKE